MPDPEDLLKKYGASEPEGLLGKYGADSVRDAKPSPPSEGEPMTNVITFDEPVEIKAGGGEAPVPEARMEQQPVREIEPEMPSFQPIIPADPESTEVPEVGAAKPVFYPLQEGVEHEAHFHVDPEPEQVVSMLRGQLEATEDPQTQGVLERQIEDINDQGEDSVHYQNYANQIWNETREVFERYGRPVVRANKAGWIEGEDAGQALETFFAKGAGEYAAPFLSALDMSTTFGMGTQAAATAGDKLEDEGTLAALQELEAGGVIPNREQRIESTREASPVASGVGFLAGMGMGAPAMLGKGGSLATRIGSKAPALALEHRVGAAASRLAPKGSGVLRQMGAGAAAGAAGAGVGRAGELGVQAAGRAIRGEEQMSAPERLGEIGAAALTGAPIGGLIPGIGAMGRGIVRRTQRGGQLGTDISKLEKSGGRARFLREPEPGPGTRNALERSDEPAEIRDPWTLKGSGVKSQEAAEDTLSRESAEMALTQLARKEQSIQRKIARDNAELYAKHNERVKFEPLVDEITDMALSRRMKAFPEVNDSVKRAMSHMVEVRVVPVDQRTPQGGRILDWDDVRGTPLEDIAIQKGRSRGMFHQPPTSLRAPDDPARRIPGALEKQWVPRQPVKVVVTPKEFTAKELEESIVQDLGAKVYANRNALKTGIAEADKPLQQLDAKIRAAREKLFGQDYVRTKTQHDRWRRDLSRAKQVYGVDDEVVLDQRKLGRIRANMAEAIGRFKQLGQTGTAQDQLNFMRRFFKENPGVLGLLDRLENMNVYRRLQGKAKPGGGVAAGGITGAPHTYMTGARDMMIMRGTYPTGKAAARLPQKMPPAVAGYLADKLGMDLTGPAQSMMDMVWNVFQQERGKRREGE